MQATMLDLRNNPKRVLQALDHNQRVTLTYRGKRKAVIVPVQQKADTGPVSRHPAFGMWKDRRDLADVDAFVRGLRQGRRF